MRQADALLQMHRKPSMQMMMMERSITLAECADANLFPSSADVADVAFIGPWQAISRRLFSFGPLRALSMAFFPPPLKPDTRQQHQQQSRVCCYK